MLSKCIASCSCSAGPAVAGDRLVSLVSPRDLCCHDAGLALVSARARSMEHELRLSSLLGLT